MKLLFLFMASWFLNSSVVGQSILKGSVLDSATNSPIPVANIFLSNTSVGTLSAENGNFTIDHFPAGRYELVVSCIGYETFVVPLQSNHLPDFLVVKLRQKVNELQEVIVEPYEKDGWEQWGKFFTESFIGTSDFAEECELMNKEAIRFRMNKKKNILTVTADEPLIIHNNALGYIVKYTLVRLQYDYTSTILYFQGYHLFEEMQPKHERQRKNWIENRKEAYSGSLMQFLRSLYRNRLIQDQFEVRTIRNEVNLEKQRVNKIVTQQMEISGLNSHELFAKRDMGFKDHDTALYYRMVMAQPRSKTIIGERLLPADSIAYGVDSTTAAFSFADTLQVVYPLKRTPAAYERRSLISNQPPKYITSELRLLNGQHVSVLANGSYFEGINLLTSGYWAWSEKIGNMLPYEYWPPK